MICGKPYEGKNKARMCSSCLEREEEYIFSCLCVCHSSAHQQNLPLDTNLYFKIKKKRSTNLRPQMKRIEQKGKKLWPRMERQMISSDLLTQMRGLRSPHHLHLLVCIHRTDSRISSSQHRALAHRSHSSRFFLCKLASIL